MQEPAQGLESIMEWPTPSSTALWVAAGCALLLLGLAVGIELLREAKARRRRLAAAWEHIESMIQARGLTEEESEWLHALIRRWSARDPLRAVSLHTHYDQCVEWEMGRIAQEGSRNEFSAAGKVLRSIRSHFGLDFVPIGQQIVSTRELNPGLTLWMTHAASSPPKWFHATVVEVDEAQFTVTPRRDDMMIVRGVQPGDEVRCRMWREEDARYAFNVTLDGKSDNPPILGFGHTSGLTRLQSRAHFRIRHDQSVTIGALHTAPNDDYAGLAERPVITRYRGSTVNLSAGGLALAVPQPLPSQVLLRLELELPDTLPFLVFLRIVATNPLSGGQHLVRTAFVKIENEDRDKIARYVMRRQQAAQASTRRMS